MKIRYADAGVGACVSRSLSFDLQLCGNRWKEQVTKKRKNLTMRHCGCSKEMQLKNEIQILLFHIPTLESFDQHYKSEKQIIQEQVIPVLDKIKDGLHWPCRLRFYNVSHTLPRAINFIVFSPSPYSCSLAKSTSVSFLCFCMLSPHQ